MRSSVRKLRRARYLAEGAAGWHGTVVEVRVFSRRGVDKDERALGDRTSRIERLAKDRDDEQAILERSFYDRLKDAVWSSRSQGPKGLMRVKITERCWRIHPRSVASVRRRRTTRAWPNSKRLQKQFDGVADARGRFDNKVEKLQRGDELPPGVMKMVKVFVAVKRKLQPGDKMAGRHGNKGVISSIVPIEDMPYLEDGTPVDIVLNPLGCAIAHERGQILETHLGWASRGLGRQIGDMSRKSGKRRHGCASSKLSEVYGRRVRRHRALADDGRARARRQPSQRCADCNAGFRWCAENDIVEHARSWPVSTIGAGPAG